MPVFEYKCSDCNTKFELLHKSKSTDESITCPKCKSTNTNKLFSSFSASVNSGTSYSPCSSGNCEVDYSSSPCANGMCGLN